MEYEVRKLQENKEPFPSDTTHYSPILLFYVCFGLASLASELALLTTTPEVRACIPVPIRIAILRSFRVY